jgi:hypothetical protein
MLLIQEIQKNIPTAGNDDFYKWAIGILMAVIIYFGRYIIKQHKEHSKDQTALVREVVTVVTKNTEGTDAMKDTFKETMSEHKQIVEKMNAKFDKITPLLIKAVKGKTN